ncbi:MAG: RNA polymerase sigma factor [Patescibacteria group bacterium]|nr:RNA polymerase sigma factor [Patescibacteria group bacterium]
MNRDQQKFSKIYDLYVESIYRFIFIKVNSQAIAEDLTSEVFLRSWQAFKEREREKIRNPRAFLYITARHIVIDFYRTKNQKQTISIENSREVEDIGERLEERENIRSDMALVHNNLKGLKQDYQNVILLRFVDELSIKEISKILNRSKGATRVLLHRAMGQLKEQINS